MSELNKKILEMVLENASVNEISAVTGLSNRQLFYRLSMLRFQGYFFSHKYYSDGEISYGLRKSIHENQDVCLFTSSKSTEIDMVFISDLHFSNEKDQVELLKQVYDFCSKEDIHVIINCGDILDGFVGSSDSKKCKTAEEQIEYLLRYYPFDKNIINFTCLGNHDYSFLETVGQDLATVLSMHRHDIVVLGYGAGILKIKNDELIVRHPKTVVSQAVKQSGFTIVGHRHTSLSTVKDHMVEISVPPLSGLTFGTTDLPGFIRAKILFDSGIFRSGNFSHYVFLDGLRKVHEASYQIYSSHKSNGNHIQYEEERVPYHVDHVKVLKKKGH